MAARGERCAAILGTGRMGSAMARRLAAAGFRVYLWNRTLGKAEVLAAEIGGVAVEEPRAAAERCRRVHLVVADDEAVYEVLTGLGGLVAGGKELGDVRVYNHVTMTPRGSLEAMRLVERAGGVYVEAPVAGNPGNALEGRLLILCASRHGEVVCRDEALEALGTPVYLGEPPVAAAAKLGFNIFFLGVVAAMGEAMALAESYGLDADRFLGEVIGRTWLRQIVERYGARIKPRGEASFTARLAGKDARYAARALQERGVPGFLASAVASYYALMSHEGYGDEDYPAIAGFLAEYARRSREPRTTA